jgi:hypothetical protein
MYNQNVELEIRVNGRAVRTYNHEGKVFAESREGSEYTIHIKNNNWYRVLVVPSIDGISTIDGKKASHDSGGYIIGAYQVYEIKGFRKDSDTVGAFRFTKKSAGYAASKGDTRNVGIISVAVFKEKQPNIVISGIYLGGYSNTNIGGGTNTPYWNDLSYSTCKNEDYNMLHNLKSDCSVNYASQLRSYSEPVVGKALTANCNNERMYSSVTKSAPTKDTFDHSTNWGNKLSDKVISGTFERESLLAQFDIYYASKEGLKTLGIEVVPKKEIAFPQGFDNKFCAPPQNWS